jgi:hypothetical protein
MKELYQKANENEFEKVESSNELSAILISELAN